MDPEIHRDHGILPMDKEDGPGPAHDQISSSHSEGIAQVCKESFGESASAVLPLLEKCNVRCIEQAAACGRGAACGDPVDSRDRAVACGPSAAHAAGAFHG